MRSMLARVVVCTSAVFAAVSFGASPGAPPIKPGLWQVTTADTADGQKTPDPSAMMNNLPPEVRAQLEAAMKARGVDMSGGAAGTRICMTRESLDKANWQNQASCTTTYSERSSSSWKWRSVCTKPAAVSDGETIFTNSENYTVKTATTITALGVTKTTQSTINGKWLGADCGDLKPITELLKKP